MEATALTEMRAKNLHAVLAGAATCLLWLALIYANELGYWKMYSAGVLSQIALVVLILPFLIFVLGADIILLFRTGWRQQDEQRGIMGIIALRFFSFAGGAFLAGVLGAMALFLVHT